MRNSLPCNIATKHQLCTMGEKISSSDRVASSLLGACIGDALAAPLHWYYDLQRMRTDIKESFPSYCKDENGRLVAFCRAPSNLKHPDSWSYFSQYNPVIDPLGIVHERLSDWTEPGTYYHAHLEPGEPTTTVQLALLLSRSLVARAGYDYSDYLDRCASEPLKQRSTHFPILRAGNSLIRLHRRASRSSAPDHRPCSVGSRLLFEGSQGAEQGGRYVRHFTTAGENRDTYLEAHVRHFFRSLRAGEPAHRCGLPGEDCLRSRRARPGTHP
jgi:hypothetical protein